MTAILLILAAVWMLSAAMAIALCRVAQQGDRAQRLVLEPEIAVRRCGSRARRSAAALARVRR